MIPFTETLDARSPLRTVWMAWTIIAGLMSYG